MPLGFNTRGPGAIADTLVKYQSGFFDRDAVKKKLHDQQHGVMSRFGAYVKTRSQSLMLRHVVRRGFGVKSKVTNREGISPPGEPPYVHEGSLVKRLFFAYDVATHSVVIGPSALNMIFFDKNRKPVKGTVPGVLEKGGQITILERQRPNGEWTRADLRSPRRLAGVPLRYRTITIKKRPYMKPAMAAELPKFVPLFERFGFGIAA